jgi:hypothetical protein
MQAWIWYLYNAMLEGRAGIRPLPVTSSESNLGLVARPTSSGSSIKSKSSTTAAKPRDSSSARTAAPTSQVKKAALKQQQVLGQGQYPCERSTIRL